MAMYNYIHEIAKKLKTKKITNRKMDYQVLEIIEDLIGLLGKN